MEHDLILCRCEEVTLREVQHAIAEGAITLHSIRAATRAGMGFCQGRTCRALVEALLQDAGCNPDGRRPLAARLPVRPVPLGVLARWTGEGEGP